MTTQSSLPLIVEFVLRSSLLCLLFLTITIGTTTKIETLTTILVGRGGPFLLSSLVTITKKKFVVNQLRYTLVGRSLIGSSILQITFPLSKIFGSSLIFGTTRIIT